MADSGMPVDLFVAEKPMLKALPPHGYDCATIDSAVVDRQFQFTVDGNRYLRAGRACRAQALAQACLTGSISTTGRSL